MTTHGLQENSGNSYCFWNETAVSPNSSTSCGKNGRISTGKLLMNENQRIQVDPNIMTGKPVIRGTRIPVELIVRMVEQGMSHEEILLEYPHLQAEDIKAAID